MSTSENKIVNIRVKDPFDVLIHEKGLRIKHALSDKDLDLMVIIFNNGKVVLSKISEFDLLRNASQQDLDKWILISGGTGIRWDELDEDLSAKGFIQSSAMYAALNNFQMASEKVMI